MPTVNVDKLALFEALEKNYSKLSNLYIVI